MANRCLGLAGWLFGHKYIKTKGGWVYESEFCYRCGKEAGSS